MSELYEQLNAWAEGDVAALVLEQPLRSVNGMLVFPPTFAPAEKNKPSDYIVDEIGERKVVTLDTPGSEANRLEPLFMKPPLKELVPEITIEAGQQKKSLFELGHRAADALVRSVKDQAPIVEKAFEQVQRGDHSALATFAPTSLIFGAWDSRGTGAKLPRLLEARIDAYGVVERKRSAQYFSSLDYVEAGLLNSSTDKQELDQRSKAGFRDAPSGRQPGGVELLPDGEIKRMLTIHLVGIQRLGAGGDTERGRTLRQYILGLALAVATAPLPLFLRQGCNLVPAQPKEGGALPTWRSVHFDGSEKSIELRHEEVLAYARAARDRFFPNGFKNETWIATKDGAQAEVKKRAKSDSEATVSTP